MVVGRPDIAIFLLWVGGGGTETVVWHLARGFVDAGYRVELVLGNAASEYRFRIPSCVRVVDLQTHGYLRTTLKLVGYLWRRRPAVLFSTLPFSALPAIAARYLSLKRCRVVVRVCNNLARRFEHERAAFPRPVRWALRSFPRLAHGVIACSTGMAEEIAGITGMPRNRIHVLYNPAITEAMARQGTEPVAHPWFAPRPDGAPAPPVVLGVGRLARQKNFALLIRAFAAVRRTVAARLLLLGEGPERARLEGLVQELGLEDEVSLAGYVANPYAYMARAGVFVLSSSWEGFGNVVAEALAMGAPVVATDCPSGPAEVLDGGRYGFLVPMDDEEAMADAIRRALAGERRGASEEWLGRFKLAEVAGRFLDVFGLPRAKGAPPAPRSRTEAGG
ncbi:MAG: glycosyltransferase [Planctomycetes bacterium]|nr:glycosyltransferase [Planctomycetota bacterium]